MNSTHCCTALYYYIQICTVGKKVEFPFTSFFWCQGLSAPKLSSFFWRRQVFHRNCGILDSVLPLYLGFVSYQLHHNTHKQQDNGQLSSMVTPSWTNMTGFLLQKGFLIFVRLCRPQIPSTPIELPHTCNRLSWPFVLQTLAVDFLVCSLNKEGEASYTQYNR